MKTNIAGLMSMIKDYEEKLILLGNEIDLHATNKVAQELSGKENILEDYKDDFNKELTLYEEIIKRITYLKKVLYEKNNEFKLSDGRSIQEALVCNANLHKLKSVYDNLLTKKNSKVRITEVNNSYFEACEVNFDVLDIKEKQKKVEDEIYYIDFEVSKLNSIEFTIDE